MSVYTTSPDVVQQFMSSRDRTAYWVSSHQPLTTEFASPSIPPSILGDPISPISPPSEVESVRSVPPKMFLKYDDGRPNVPISHWHYEGDAGRGGSRQRSGDSLSRSQTQTTGRSRTRSHGPMGDGHNTESTKLGREGSRRHREQRVLHPAPPPAPEEIRVLPSPTQANDAPRASHGRSKSVPRDARQDGTSSPPPLPVPYHAQLNPMYTQAAPHQPITTSQSQPLPWHMNPERGYHPSSSSQKHSARAPSATVYAPANHSKTNYVPPAMYPSRNAPGMSLSHSAPIPPSHYAQQGIVPYNAIRDPHSRLASVREDRSRSRGRVRVPDDCPSDTESHESGSTYYVVPTHGQKIHVISPDKSISTATSTTKSPTSARSSKKPFFLRLFGIGEKALPSNTDVKVLTTKPSNGNGRRLVRRHSAGAAARGPTKEQRGER